MRDFEARLRELAALTSGWLGENRGEPVSHAALLAVRPLLTWIMQERLPEPWIFPTEEGAVQLEWEQGHGIAVVISDGGYEVLTDGDTAEFGCVKQVHVLLRERLKPATEHTGPYDVLGAVLEASAHLS
ncbi:hypothetical protein GCM10027059_50140 [Myceligenerans halotolerans]